MSLTKLEPGHLLKQSTLKTQHGNGTDRLDLSFSAGRGRRFVSVLLGVEPTDGSKPLEPTACMNAMGWVFQPDGVDLVVLLTAAVAVIGDRPAIGKAYWPTPDEDKSRAAFVKKLKTALKAMKK